MKLLAGAVFLLSSGVFLHHTEEFTGATQVLAILLLVLSLALALALIALGLKDLIGEVLPDENDRLFNEFLSTDVSMSDLSPGEQHIRFIAWKRRRSSS